MYIITNGKEEYKINAIKFYISPDLTTYDFVNEDDDTIAKVSIHLWTIIDEKHLIKENV